MVQEGFRVDLDETAGSWKASGASIRTGLDAIASNGRGLDADAHLEKMEAFKAPAWVEAEGPP